MWHYDKTFNLMQLIHHKIRYTQFSPFAAVFKFLLVCTAAIVSCSTSNLKLANAKKQAAVHMLSIQACAVM